MGSRHGRCSMLSEWESASKDAGSVELVDHGTDRARLRRSWKSWKRLWRHRLKHVKLRAFQAWKRTARSKTLELTVRRSKCVMNWLCNNLVKWEHARKVLPSLQVPTCGILISKRAWESKVLNWRTVIQGLWELRPPQIGNASAVPGASP